MKKGKSEEIRPDRSILQLFEDEEKKIRTETEALDREMFAKLKVKMGELEAARKVREGGEAELERMKAAFSEVETKTIAEEKEMLTASGKTQTDFLAGRIGADEYMRDGLTPEETAKRATAKTRGRLSGMMTEIRKKALAVIDLEIAECTIEMDVSYLTSYPGQNEIARLKSHVQALEARITAAMQGWPAARARLDQLKNIRSGLEPGGQRFNQTEADVKALRFDPAFPEKYLGKLEEIVQAITGMGKKYRISWSRQGVSYFEE